MEYRILGRTGLRVSRLGVGTGGPSQFGQKSGVSENDIGNFVRLALDRGINYFDTAASYRESEALLGRALLGVPRESYILSTKFQVGSLEEPTKPEQLVQSVERSLVRLRVETIDIVQYHGLLPKLYARAVENLMPALLMLKDEGKIRFIGVTEKFGQDGPHEMLAKALRDDCFDTIMVGYNLLNPVPEKTLLPLCREKTVGVICMVPVRRSLAQPEHLRERLDEAIDQGWLDSNALSGARPLDWLVKGPVTSLPAAGYKYVAAHPAIHTILSGTSNSEHLEENIKAVEGPPLPEEDMARLRSIFGDVWHPLVN